MRVYLDDYGRNRKKPNARTMDSMSSVEILEEGISKIGELRLVFDKEYEKYEDQEIKTIMKFGGTFIDVTAIHLKSGKSVNTTLTFD